MCYTEKAIEARHRLERQYKTCANCKKQCRPNETKPYSNAFKRQNNPTNGHTPSCIKSTHTSHINRDAGAREHRSARHPPPHPRLDRAFYPPWHPGSSPTCPLRLSSAIDLGGHDRCRTIRSRRSRRGLSSSRSRYGLCCLRAIAGCSRVFFTCACAN